MREVTDGITFLMYGINRLTLAPQPFSPPPEGSPQEVVPPCLPPKMSAQGTNLAAIRPGFKGSVDAVVVRMWHNYFLENRLMSTDYILADAQKNVIHCTTKSDIAHVFSRRLKLGQYATFSAVEVMPNLPNYRVVRRPRFMLEMTGRTNVCLLPDVPPNVEWPYFDFTPFGNVKADDNNTLTDVLGRVSGVKEILTRPTTTSTYTKKDSRSIDFTLHDNEGQHVRITLWDSMVDEFMKSKPVDEGKWVIALVAMNPRPFKETMCLSSTSATQVYWGSHIRPIAEFVSTMGEHIIQNCPPDRLTIMALSEWTSLNKLVSTFKIKASISDIDPKRGWYYLSCTTPRCFKKVNPTDSGFSCPQCCVKIEIPLPRYKIKANIHDETGHATITMFDNPSEQLLGITANDLVAQMESEGIIGGMPPLIAELINSAHVMEISSKPYTEQGMVTYVCRRIASSVQPRSKNVAAGIPTAPSNSNLAHPTSQTPKKKEHSRVHPQDHQNKSDQKGKRPRMLDCLREGEEEEVTSAQHSST